MVIQIPNFMDNIFFTKNKIQIRKSCYNGHNYSLFLSRNYFNTPLTLT
jgi:hypothetical protein